MKLGEIALFTARVSDLTDFYKRLFDTEPVYANPGKSVFVLGDVHVLIHDGNPPVPHEGPLFDADGYPPEKDHIAFHVPDLDKAIASLDERGIAAEVRDFEWGRSAYLLDPDGRRLELQAESEATYGHE